MDEGTSNNQGNEQNNLSRPIRNKSTKSYTCPKCNATYDTYKKCSYHIMTEHDAEQFQCTICLKNFVTPATLRDHMRRHNNEFQYFCEECSKGFYTVQTYNRHIKVHHLGTRYICFPCNKVFLSQTQHKVHVSSIHDPSSNPEQNTCSKCGQMFQNKYYLAKHIRRHEAPRYVCDICGKALTSSDGLIIHKRLHTGEKPFVCSYCGQSFHQQTNLRRHVKVVHLQEKHHSCAECGKKFAGRTELVNHTRTHTGERPFACHLCSKSFSNANIKRQHIKVMHSTAKPFACHICDKKFACKTQVKTHQKVHGTSLDKIVGIHLNLGL